MKDFLIAASADWHIGNANEQGEYPIAEEIQASLREALEKHVDAYIFAGDLVDKGSSVFAPYAASIIRPYIDEGLKIIVVEGNHDRDRMGKSVVSALLQDSGAIVLDDSSYTLVSRDGKKQMTIIGVSGEVDPKHDKWKTDSEGGKAGWEKAHNAGRVHYDALEKELAQSADNVLVVTHRGIIADTVGTAAKEGTIFSPSVSGFADLIDSYAVRRNITALHGHNHGNLKGGWEGFPYGQTKGGVDVFNVAAPVRRRSGKGLAKYISF